MKRMSFSCGDKVNIQGKLRLETAIVCESVDTTDENLKVRIVTEDGKVINKAVGELTKK